MTTFVLLTMTGLGLGALYFLDRVGPLADLRPDGRAQLRPRRLLSVGAYCDLVGSPWRLPASAPGLKLARRRSWSARPWAARSLAALVELVVDPAALPPPGRAGARHGRAGAGAARAACRAIWGSDARPFPVPGLDDRHHERRSARRSRTTGFVLIAAAASSSSWR